MGNYLAKCSKTFSSQGEWGEEQQKSDRANHLNSDAVHSEHCHQYDQDGGVDDDNAVKLVIFLQGEIHLKRRLSGLPVNMHCRVAPSLYSVL